MKKLNWNAIIKVKLTPYGKNIFYHRLDRLIEKGIDLKREWPPVDKDGFSEFQLWSFIHTYGPYIHMGTNDVVEEIYFYIKEEDLECVGMRCRDCWSREIPEEQCNCYEVAQYE